MGPVAYMNTIRFESKHKVFKDFIHSSKNFKNLCKTLAIRHQQNIAMSNFSYKDEISFGYRCAVTIDDCEDDDDLVRIVQSNESVFETKHFICNDYKYRKNMFILSPKGLMQIKKILLISNKCSFLCLHHELLEYVPFLNSYRITLKLPLKTDLIKFEELHFPKPYERKFVNNDQFILAETLKIKKYII